MPTYWTQTLIPTLRETPAEAEVPSHQLMLRAGLIHRLGAGVYDYLPLGIRSLQKATAIVREEMDAAGACEVLMATLHPIELWERTDRREAYGDNLFVLEDRHGREFALGPTHEEIITTLVGSYVESYKDLPKTFYQIQTKFRDEFRPRFGVLRSREFQMKDAYSFHLKLDGGEGSGSLDETYQKQYRAYCRIFERCRVPYRVVEAESGPIGGSASHEFMVPSPTGEDTILESDKGNYAANVEKAEIGRRAYSDAFAACSRDANTTGDAAPAGDPTGELESVHTPGCPGIDDVADFFKKNLKTKLKTSNMLKSLVYVATRAGEEEDTSPWYVLAIARGDHDVNEAKLKAAVSKAFGQSMNVEMAPVDIAKKDGWYIGFVGPHALVGRDDTRMFVDADASLSGFWVTGANEVDHHIKHFNWKREVLGPLGDKAKDLITVADIRNAAGGDPSPKNDGGALRETKGIEIGHIFKLGTKYTDALDVTVLDENNTQQRVLMGCYGIGVNRILASAIERAAGDGAHAGNDENGIIWPTPIAPFQVIITPIKYEGEVKDVVAKLAGELEQTVSPTNPRAFREIDVLIDDRDERPGVKFKDADLIGIPIRITVGDKGLANGVVELFARDGSLGKKGELVKVENAVQRVVKLLRTL